MQIYSLQSFTGRNVFSHKPVIKMVLDIGVFYKSPTSEIEGFNSRLLSLFPGLYKHYCSLGFEGGFVERLKEGTFIGHVTEHLILELQSMAGYEVFYGKTRIIREPSLYYIVYEYENEVFGMECGKAAVKIVSALANGHIIDIDVIIEGLKRIAVEFELGPSTKAIYDEAKKRDIPVMRLGSESLIQLGHGKNLRLVEASLSDASSCISVDIAGNKHLTKQILTDNKIPVPYGGIAYTEESAVSVAEEIGYPVVVKPYDANQGKGVTIDIKDGKQVRTAYGEAVKYSKGAIVEKYIKGNDYRVLVVGDKVAAVAERRPPYVVGDGRHNIRELVELENNDPLRGMDHEKPLTRIKLDSMARQVLAESGLNENHIPYAGERVKLRGNGNLSTGGTARDCTDEIHPYNCSLAVKSAKAIGLDIAGIDITAVDISVPVNGLNGAVVEINAAPGLRMHLYPTEGKSRNVAGDIIEMMYPEGEPCSVPIISVTGTNGKTTTTRLISHIMALAGKRVGMASTSGVFIDNKCTLKGDNTGPVSARMVLSNREVEAAVLETARGGIVKKGLGYDLADVGVIVNVSEDHLGLDGIETIEDLAFVKSLVIEAIRPEGYAVLNADDKMRDFFLKRVNCRVVLFSCEKDNPAVLEHVKNGGKAVYLDNGNIYICNGALRHRLINIKDIPITFGGIVECNIENSLAAVSAIHALDVPLGIIKTGLKTFMPDLHSNPGRFNIFDMGDFKVMLDYGHNPAGYNAVIKAAKKMGANRLVGIIGVPGDRLDRNIREIGEICSKAFSKIYIKEDDDLRDRKQGEVSGILYDEILKSGTKKENIEIIFSELKALETAILDAQPGDLIIMHYEKFEPALELINRLKHELSENIVREALIEESAG